MDGHAIRAAALPALPRAAASRFSQSIALAAPLAHGCTADALAIHGSTARLGVS
jgi:hypothetical protein